MGKKLGAIADGAAEDMIRAFVQIGCSEGHVKTLIEKYSAELTNGIVDSSDDEAVKAHIELINDSMEELDALAELRRSTMLFLMETYGGTKEYWCLVKHLGVGAYNLFEAYQATEDAQLLNLALDANARFTKALTRFLGTEITDCAACFADAIKAKGERSNDNS